MGFGFGLFGMMFNFVYIAVLVIVIVAFAKGISQWNKNNNSPRLTVPASIVAKRQHTSYHHHAGTNHHGHSSTSYYITFQVESGDRMELHIPSNEYGMLAEGDQGQLSFQGTRYLGFQRKY